MRIAFGAVLSLLLNQAAATVIYDNGGPDIVRPDAVSSDLAGGSPIPFPLSEIADDFSPSVGSGEVHGVRWWGGYADRNTPVSDNFAIRIYENDASGPDEANFQTIFSGDPGRTFTGLTITVSPFQSFGFDLYEYFVSVTPVTLIAGQPYWLSIVNSTEDDADDSWFWFASDGAQGDGQRRISSTTDFYVHEGLSRGTEFAFQLTGVPEPTTFALLALGLAGIGHSMRRKARQASKDATNRDTA